MDITPQEQPSPVRRVNAWAPLSAESSNASVALGASPTQHLDIVSIQREEMAKTPNRPSPRKSVIRAESTGSAYLTEFLGLEATKEEPKLSKQWKATDTPSRKSLAEIQEEEERQKRRIGKAQASASSSSQCWYKSTDDQVSVNNLPLDETEVVYHLVCSTFNSVSSLRSSTSPPFAVIFPDSCKEPQKDRNGRKGSESSSDEMPDVDCSSRRNALRYCTWDDLHNLSVPLLHKRKRLVVDNKSSLIAQLLTVGESGQARTRHKMYKYRSVILRHFR